MAEAILIPAYFVYFPSSVLDKLKHHYNANAEQSNPSSAVAQQETIVSLLCDLTSVGSYA